MVEIEEVTPTSSEERLLDAQAIEEAAAQMTRITAKLHLEALAKKLRKESDALKRVEKSRAMLAKAEAEKTASAASSGGNMESIASMEDESKEESASSLSSQDSPAPPVAKSPAVAKPPPLTDQAKYVPIDKFAFDFGGYNSKFVTIYIDLPFVGTIPKDQITCDFQTSSFDLIVKNLEQKSYRLVKTNLEKDIDPLKSKFIVKSDKIVIKLAKIQSEYGSFDHWSKLTDEKKGVKSSSTKKKSDDPTAGLMDMMKEMYDSGDDNMKKVIGETMMKQRRGELGQDSGFGDL